LETLELGTSLHDIGKVAVDDNILRKPDKLTQDEFKKMQMHTTAGAKVLDHVPEMRRFIPIVKHHHERWDGNGYPDRLKGEAIPLVARIVAVVDTFDAMTTERTYIKARPPEVAFAEIERMANSQFDPQCVTAFLAIQAQIVEVMRSDHQTAVVSSAESPSERPWPTLRPQNGTATEATEEI
jgi:HD-GYP domain-containing protein (c-di-GMP phosphodiesterase class II)